MLSLTYASHWYDLFQNINELYKINLQKLKNFVMVKFTKDTIVQPIESEWFGFYRENDLNATYSLQESKLYLEVKDNLLFQKPHILIHFKIKSANFCVYNMWLTI